MSDRPIFAPLPARAMVDRRLQERHLRTLAVVAAHDRLDKNGAGCWASHDRPANMVGCNYSRLSANLRDLGEWGYIQQSVHPLNKRQRVYRVVYTPDDAAVMKGVAASNSLPPGKVSHPDSLPTGHEKGSDSLPGPTGSKSKTNGLGGVNIFPERENRFRRNEGRDTPEGAPPTSDGARLAKIERALRAGLIPSDSLLDCHRCLSELVDEYGAHENPIGGWAYRLADEVFGLLSPEQQQRLYQ